MQRKANKDAAFLLLYMVSSVAAIEPVTVIALSRAVTSVALKSSETIGYGMPLGGYSRVCYKNGVTVAPKSWTDLFILNTRVVRMRAQRLMASGLLIPTLAAWFLLAEEEGVWVPICICDIVQQVADNYLIKL